jgi:hypothetical protein
VDERLERILRSTSSPPTRRAVMRGLAWVLAAAGLGTMLPSEGDARWRRRSRRRKACRRDNQCEPSLNPCWEARCKNHRCRTRTLANGTVCGDALVCQDGACLCPNGICTVTVNQNDLGPWVALDNFLDVDTSLLTFENGPGTPPHGAGSVKLTATDESFVLATFQYSGVALPDITAPAYSTYQPSTNTDDPTNAGILTMAVDFFGQRLPGDLIQFIPAENGTPVMQDAWQTWDAINGGAGLWSYAQGCGCTWPNSAIPGDTPRTWADITPTYKLATITTAADPFFGIVVTNADDGKTFVDHINAVTFGTTSGTTRFVFGPA